MAVFHFMVIFPENTFPVLTKNIPLYHTTLPA